jgi:DASH complex subunit DAM1
METVVEAMMDSEGRGVKCMFFSSNLLMPRILTTEYSGTYPVLDLVAPPDLNQARVNKCLIALVNRKIVQKDNSTVRTLALFSFRIKLT